MFGMLPRKCFNSPKTTKIQVKDLSTFNFCVCQMYYLLRPLFLLNCCDYQLQMKQFSYWFALSNCNNQITEWNISSIGNIHWIASGGLSRQDLLFNNQRHSFLITVRTKWSLEVGVRRSRFVGHTPRAREISSTYNPPPSPDSRASVPERIHLQI